MNEQIVIIIRAGKNGVSLSAPLDSYPERQAVIELLKGAIDTAKNYKGNGLLIANNALVTEMAPGTINHQTKINL
jgi:hypothetical protein